MWVRACCAGSLRAWPGRHVAKSADSIGVLGNLGDRNRGDGIGRIGDGLILCSPADRFVRVVGDRFGSRDEPRIPIGAMTSENLD